MPVVTVEEKAKATGCVGLCGAVVLGCVRFECGALVTSHVLSVAHTW